MHNWEHGLFVWQVGAVTCGLFEQLALCRTFKMVMGRATTLNFTIAFQKPEGHVMEPMPKFYTMGLNVVFLN